MSADQKIIGPQINAKNTNQIKDGSHGQSAHSRLAVLKLLNYQITQLPNFLDSRPFAKFAAKFLISAHPRKSAANSSASHSGTTKFYSTRLFSAGPCLC